MKRWSIIVVAVLVLTAGCSGLPIIGDESSTEAPTDSPDEPETDVYQAEDIDLDTVLIDLSTLPRQYSPTGVSRTNTTASRDESAIQKKAERAFQLEQTENGTDQPFYILSGAILYDSSTAASGGVDRLLNQNLTSSQSYSSASGHQATIGVFEMDSGLQATVVVSQRGNLVYYSLLAGPGEYEAMSKELMDEMYVSLPNA